MWLIRLLLLLSEDRTSALTASWFSSSSQRHLWNRNSEFSNHRFKELPGSSHPQFDFLHKERFSARESHGSVSLTCTTRETCPSSSRSSAALSHVPVSLFPRTLTPAGLGWLCFAFWKTSWFWNLHFLHDTGGSPILVEVNVSSQSGKNYFAPYLTYISRMVDAVLRCTSSSFSPLWDCVSAGFYLIAELLRSAAVSDAVLSLSKWL